MNHWLSVLHDQKQELEFWFDDKLQDFRCKRGLYLFSGPVGSGKTSLMFDLAPVILQIYKLSLLKNPLS
ncbi:hypothetical protein ICE98_03844 [Lactococcus lactis]|nr:hypothetical protein [Lactococcus lactis]